MALPPLLYRPRRVPRGRSGTLIDLSPRKVGWEWIHFRVRQLAPGAVWQSATGSDELCLVLLNGGCEVSWASGACAIGPRAGVFGSYPHAVYLPPWTRFAVQGDGGCELAECRARVRRSRRDLAPRVVRPEDCGFEIRGGSNATRQIVDIIRPEFPADRLLVCEVYTPGGNWSSYPPHKHDTDNPPREVALEEIYYFGFRDPNGYGLQRVYSPRRDETVKVEHGDVVAIREGYHPFVTAYGYDAYYLNVLAGERRSMAASDDPQYASFRRTWPAPDPRVPIVPPPPGVAAAIRAAVGEAASG